MKLTQNFTLEELSKTSTGYSNTPGKLHIENLQRLCNSILQPLRDAYGKPIVVHSGYRSPKVNKAVGGVLNSQHMLGQAADISVARAGKTEAQWKEENRQLFNLVRTLQLPFDQLIDEQGYRWLHISYGPRNRRQVLHLK